MCYSCCFVSYKLRVFSFFIFYCFGDPCGLCSFPTRRSSDLAASKCGTCTGQPKPPCGPPAPTLLTPRTGLLSATQSPTQIGRASCRERVLKSAVLLLSRIKEGDYWFVCIITIPFVSEVVSRD